MNEEFQNKLGLILDLIVKGMTTVGDFVMEQLPDIAQQYVIYGRAWNTAVSVVLIAIVIFWLCKVNKVFFSKHSENYSQDACFGMVVISIIMCFMAVPATYFYAKDTALVWFAPKIWLIKEAADIIKPSATRRK